MRPGSAISWMPSCLWSWWESTSRTSRSTSSPSIARDPRRGDLISIFNPWDAYAASASGMRVVWCNRYGQRSERLPGQPDREIPSLEEPPPLVGA